MSLEGLKARFDQLLAELGRVGDARAAAPGLFAAMVDLKSAIGSLRDGIARTERELAAERRQLEDAERRGGLAAGIGDQETAELAGIWVSKHRERVDILERKRTVQADELAYAERQLAEIGEAYRRAKLGITPGGATPSEPVPEGGADHLDLTLDRQAQDALVREQLAHLKRKLGQRD